VQSPLSISVLVHVAAVFASEVLDRNDETDPM
jgi:hypothetical protein